MILMQVLAIVCEDCIGGEVMFQLFKDVLDLRMPGWEITIFELMNNDMFFR